MPWLKAVESKVAYMEAVDLAQLHRWQPWMHEHGKMSKSSTTLRDRLFSSLILNSGTVTKLQRSVIHILRMLSQEAKEDTSTKSGYSSDALVSWRGHKVGAEVDGPSHVVDRKPTGANYHHEAEAIT